MLPAAASPRPMRWARLARTSALASVAAWARPLRPFRPRTTAAPCRRLLHGSAAATDVDAVPSPTPPTPEAIAARYQAALDRKAREAGYADGAAMLAAREAERRAALRAKEQAAFEADEQAVQARQAAEDEAAAMAAYQAEDAAAAAAAAAAASPEVLAAPSEQATPSEQTTTTTAAAAKPSPARPRAFRDPPTTPTLSTVMNVEKLGPLTAEQVGALWNGYHARKALSLSGVMPSDFWARLAARAARCPTFVLPLPRDGGWEFVLMEWQGRVLSFTPLVEYKAHGAAARPHLVVTHFTELAQDKGLVLMAGEITPCPKAAAEALLASPPGSDPVAAAARPPTGLLTPAEAQNLVYQMQEFYVTGSDTKRALVQTFHEDPARFAYHQVIEAVEKLDDGDITAALDAAPSAAGASAAPSAATKA